MQRETTNRDFPVNFRGIALTGEKTSQMIILLVRYSLTQHYTHSCKDLLFNARSNKSTSQQTQLDLSIFHIRLVSLRPLCLPLWASSCGCPKVFTLIPSINIILIVWDTIFMIVIVAVLMISSIFIWILKYYPVSALLPVFKIIFILMIVIVLMINCNWILEFFFFSQPESSNIFFYSGRILKYHPVTA